MGKGGAHGSLTPRIFGESRNRYEHLRCHLTWHCRIGIDFQGIYGHNNLITPKPSLLFSSIIEVIRDFSPGTGGVTALLSCAATFALINSKLTSR